MSAFAERDWDLLSPPALQPDDFPDLFAFWEPETEW